MARWQRLNGLGCQRLSNVTADAATTAEEKSLLECTAELPCEPVLDPRPAAATTSLSTIFNVESTPPKPVSLQPALDVVHLQPQVPDPREEIMEQTILEPLPSSQMHSLLMVSELDSEAHESAIDVLPTSGVDVIDCLSMSETSEDVERTEMLTQSSAAKQVDVSISTVLAHGLVEEMASSQVHNTSLELDPILPLCHQESIQTASPLFLDKQHKDEDALLKPPKKQFLKPIVDVSPKKQKTGITSELSKKQQLKVADVVCTPGRCDTIPLLATSRPNVTSNEFELSSEMEDGFLKALASLDVLKFHRKRMLAADA